MKTQATTKFAIFACAFAAVLAECGAATPQISSMAVAQNRDGSLAVSYSIDTDAIVTMDVLTNGVSIGPDKVATVVGDLNAKVSAGSGKRGIWFARNDWPDMVAANATVKLTAWSVGAPPDYMAIDLTVPNVVRYYVSSNAVPYGVTNALYKTDVLLLRKIPARGVIWRMGQPSTAEPNGGTDLTNGLGGNGTFDNETGHLVMMTNDYYCAVYETTQRQYFRIIGSNPSNFKQETEVSLAKSGPVWFRPVESTSYDTLRGTASASHYNWPVHGHEVAASSSIGKFRSHSGVSTLDLPTEAQWEYACRAGTGTGANTGVDATSANLQSLAWFNLNAEDATHAVGQKIPNAWGLYDMHGNVTELCLDWAVGGDAYRATFADGYATGAVTLEPAGPVRTESLTEGVRAFRGGEYNYSAQHQRSAARRARASATAHQRTGFRLVCTIPVE